MRRIGNGGNDIEFLKLHADVLVIGRENAKRTDVHRKNGIIVNEGRVLSSILSRVDNMTPQEVKQRRMYNLKKYGLSNEEIDKVVIPVLSEKQTSEVFDKRTNKQLEREQLLSRLAVLRSALQYLQKGLLGRDAGGLRLFLDLLTVFVRSGQEHHVIAAQTLIARDRIGRDRAVGVADVQFVRRVIDRRCDIKLSFAHTAFSSVLVFTGVTGVVDRRVLPLGGKSLLQLQRPAVCL